MKYHIKKENGKQIFAFLKSIKRVHSKNEEKLRIFMEAVWYIVRSGCQWRLLPRIYGYSKILFTEPSSPFSCHSSAPFFVIPVP
ncbi:transposase [Wolbachia pipientis]|uniref:Transposase n=1 Tax=Wolbachia pipientis TaxID=955 RepID=A0A7G5CB60_WOLPI|nr:transposase [Wolbachia pipientis]QMV46444.1 transposase [Wolbachia pipientis]